MATLTGKKIADTYKDLLQVSNGNSGVDSTLRDVSDGEGTSSALKVSSDAISVDNIKIDGNTISATSGGITLTPLAGSAITLDSSVTIDGGAVDITGDLDVDNLNLNGNTITATSGGITLTPAAGSAITLDTSVTVDGGAVDITGDLDVDNININGNTISSTDSAGDINITPDTTGDLVLDGVKWPQADGTAEQVLTTDGSAQASWAAVSSVFDVVDDTTPQLGGNLDANSFNIDFDNATGLRDSNAAKQLTFNVTSSAVNYFAMTNAATGNGPILSATGTDTNIDFNFQAQGTGSYLFKGTSTWSAEIRLAEDTDNGTNYMAFKAPVSVTSSTTLTLPDGDGSANQVLKTDAAGTLSWASLDTLDGTLDVDSGGTGATTLTDGGVLLGSGTGAITAMAVLADGEMIVGDGTTDPVAESGATLRTSIGVGTGDSPTFTALSLNADTNQIILDADGTTTTITDSATSNRVVTLPDATDTLVGRDTTDTLTNKTLTSPVLNTGLSGTAFLDEDNMASDAADKVASQQSIKAYADTKLANVGEDTTPQLGGHLDVNGQVIGDGTRELLTFTEDGSAVNHLNIENQATGGGPILSAAGDDTDIDLHLANKGTGALTVDGTATSAAEIRLAEDTDNGTNYTGLKAAAAITTSYTLNLPAATGTAEQILETDGSGNLSWVNNGAGLSNVVDDTTPQLGGMLDVNGNAIGDGTLELLTFTEDASAVNHVNIENEATGSGPIIAAAGDDTDVDLNIDGKGTGLVNVSGQALAVDYGTTGPGAIRLLEDGDNGSNYIGFAAPAALTGDTTFTLPDGDGSAEQILETNGSGTLSWVTPAAGGGDFTLIATGSASASASVDFDNNIDSTYDVYKVVFTNAVPATAGNPLVARVGTGVTPTYQTSSYRNARSQVTDGGTASGAGGTSDGYFKLGDNGGGYGSNDGVSGEITLYHPNDTTVHTLMTGLVAEFQSSSPQLNHQSCVSVWDSATAVTSVQFLALSGNLTTGDFYLFGYALS